MHIGAGRGIRAIYLPVLLIILFVSSITMSCSQNGDDNKPSQTPYLEQEQAKVERMWDDGLKQESMHYLDSVYRSYPQHNVVDKFEYYSFFCDKYSRLGNDERSVLYIDSMLSVLEDSMQADILTKRYAQANYFMGDRLLNKGDYKDAYKYYFKARTISIESNDSCSLGYYDYKAGQILYRGGRFREAVSYFKKAFAEFTPCNDIFVFYYRKQQLLDNLGLCYNHLQLPDSALFYYRFALDFIDTSYQKFPGREAWKSELAKGVVWGNMGSAYMTLGEYDKAKQYFRKSIEMNDRAGYDEVDANITRAKLGLLYLEKGEAGKAKAIADTIALFMHTNADRAVDLKWNQLMHKYYATMNRQDLAYPHLLKYTQLDDSIRRMEKRSHPVEIDEKIHAMESDYNVQLLKKKDELQKVYLGVAMLICAMAAVTVLLVIQNWRKSRRHIKVLISMNERINEQRTKLKNALDELENVGNEKDRILKAVSHDMRSPVNSALALVDLLLSQPESFSEDQLEYLNLIKKSCENALNLTKDLLEVATLNTEKLAKELTDITALIKNNTELLNYRAAEKLQKLSLDLPQDHISVYINSEKIARVINNLVTNAIKFSSSGSTINIRMESADDDITISVQDQGIGIPEHMKDRIFDLFTEAKRFGTSGEQPFGLGLSISKQIIEVHSGKIWFESTEGKGTTFYIKLPRQQ